MVYTQLNESNYNDISMNLIKLVDSSYVSGMNMIKPTDSSYHQGDMNLLSPVNSNYDISMNLIGLIDSSYISGMNMVKPTDSSYHQGDMNMVKLWDSSYVSGMNMVKPIDSSYHQGDMNMVKSIDSSYHQGKSNLIETINTDEHQYHNQMGRPTITNFKPQIDMIPLSDESSKSDMDMIKPEISEYSTNMNMVKLDQDISKVDKMDMIKPNIITYDTSLDMVKLDQDISKVDKMDMIKPEISEYSTNMDMVKPNITEYSTNIDMVKLEQSITGISEMNMIKPDITEYSTNMDMVKLEQNNISINSSNMVSIDDQPYDINMQMQSINTSVSSIPIIPMTELTQNTHNSPTPQLKPNDYNYDVSMNFVRINDVSVHSEIIPVQPTGIDVNRELRTTDNILKGQDYSTKMEMVPLSYDASLSDKVQMLVSLTDADISKANIEQLLSLSDIIDKTVKQIKGIQDNMVLTENKPDIPPHIHHEMVAIKQPPRRQFIADKLINEVDENAILRAQVAQADNTKDNKGTGYTSQNRKGVAL